MTYYLAVGTDTGSLEDPDQLVLAMLPDEFADWESEELSAYFDEHWSTVEHQPLVGLDDVLESFVMALAAEGIAGPAVTAAVITARNAVDNN